MNPSVIYTLCRYLFRIAASSSPTGPPGSFKLFYKLLTLTVMLELSAVEFSAGAV